MECRAVNRQFQCLFEMVSLRWMSDAFSRAAMQRRHERHIEHNRGQEVVYVDGGVQEIDTIPYHDTHPNELPYEMRSYARALTLSSFTFSLHDATWLVQQCRRWQSNNTGDDPSTYWVTETTAEVVYEVFTSQLLETWCHGIRSLKLMDVVAQLFTRRGHADQWAKELREGETERRVNKWTERDQHPRVHLLLQYGASEAMQRMVTRQWMRSSTGQPLLLHVPSSVIVHSILSFVDFEPLVQLRHVSRSFQPLVESAAVVWMNCTFRAQLHLR
jgi:hypothetical protein